MLIFDVRRRAKRYGETSPKPALHICGRRRERHQVNVVFAPDAEDVLAVRIPRIVISWSGAS